MNADIKGALDQINSSYRSFEHKGKRMTKEQVRKVLEHGLIMGYKHTGEIPEKEIDVILENMQISDLVKRLKADIAQRIKLGCELSYVSWGMQEGVLISVNEAKQIADVLSLMVKQGSLFTLKLKQVDHENTSEGQNTKS